MTSLPGLATRVTCALVLATSLTATVDATTLAIIRTADEIVIAADSLLTLYGRRPQLTCKIQRYGDVVFATAGLVVSTGGVVEFPHGDHEYPQTTAPVVRASHTGGGMAQGAAAANAEADGA